MKFKQTEDVDVDIDMSPMIDMVFLLLIFFIVASVMVEDKPEVNLPFAGAAKVPDEITGRLNVSVGMAEGEPVYYAGSVEITMEDLQKHISDSLDENPELRIFIRSDELVPYRVNKQLMKACADVGAVDLIYGVFEE